MFERIFGTYLLKNGKLSETQLSDIYSDKGHMRVRLGTIAVSEHFMTEEQADEVNYLQSISDRRFGDIAVEKGYLSEAQVDSLLKKQGNSFLHFLQSIIDKGLYTLDELDGFLQEYQTEMGISNSDMDDLICGDIFRAVNVFLPSSSEYYSKLCGIAIRTYIRLIDANAYVEKAYLTDKLIVDRFASQRLEGDHIIVSGFAGNEDDLIVLADTFAKESFECVDLDALDAVAEFTNCVNGLFASEISLSGAELELAPPDFYDSRTAIEGKGFCVLPVISSDRRIFFVVAFDTELKASMDKLEV